MRDRERVWREGERMRERERVGKKEIVIEKERELE